VSSCMSRPGASAPVAEARTLRGSGLLVERVTPAPARAGLRGAPRRHFGHAHSDRRRYWYRLTAHHYQPLDLSLAITENGGRPREGGILSRGESWKPRHLTEVTAEPCPPGARNSTGACVRRPASLRNQFSRYRAPAPMPLISSCFSLGFAAASSGTKIRIASTAREWLGTQHPGFPASMRARGRCGRQPSGVGRRASTAAPFGCITRPAVHPM
jgi:hypothetical protein